MGNAVNSCLAEDESLTSQASGQEPSSGPAWSPFRPMSRRAGIHVGWSIAQVANLAVTVALLIGLVLWPETALWLMWNLLIPVLPASFMISPLLWRGICPLATLNQWSSGLLGRWRLASRLLAAANALGILLLVLLVPARRFLLNENGPALAATIATVALAAVILGALFDGRAGFCNAICPVLPVERLYGQHPLFTLANPRCDRCTLCIPKGCLELDATKSFAQGVGRVGTRYGWLTTTYGIFAAALPGFIIAYYTSGNVRWSAATEVYLWITSWSAASYLATMCVVRLFELNSRVGLALLAASSVTLYYFWAVPLIAEVLHLPASGVVVLRLAVLALVSFWLVRAWRRLRTIASECPN